MTRYAFELIAFSFVVGLIVAWVMSIEHHHQEEVPSAFVVTQQGERHE